MQVLLWEWYFDPGRLQRLSNAITNHFAVEAKYPGTQTKKAKLKISSHITKASRK